MSNRENVDCYKLIRSLLREVADKLVLNVNKIHKKLKC